MRAQIVEKQKMAAIGQIAAGVAHEVCNPLSSISSVIQMLRRDERNARYSEQFNLIDMHIERISTVVRQLINMARPGSNQFQPIDMRSVLEGAVRIVSFDKRAQNINVAFEESEVPLRTYGLPDQIQQAVINLLFNALDAMPNGGTLTLRAISRGNRIVVEVEDTGCGIAKEVGRRVFEPFFTTKDPGRGTGLGLAVTYGVIQKHGGTIDFTSTPGNGTLFTFEIPILDKSPDSQNDFDYGTAGRR